MACLRSLLFSFALVISATGEATVDLVPCGGDRGYELLNDPDLQGIYIEWAETQPVSQGGCYERYPLKVIFVLSQNKATEITYRKPGAIRSKADWDELALVLAEDHWVYRKMQQEFEEGVLCSVHICPDSSQPCGDKSEM